MKLTRRGRFGLGVLCLGLLLVGAKPVLDLNATNWEFPSLVFKGKAKAKGIGSAKAVRPVSLDVTLESEAGSAPTSGTWSGSHSAGLSLSGTYQRKTSKSRSLTFTLDHASEIALAQNQAQELEDLLEAEGIEVDGLDLTLVKSKMKMAIKLKKDGMAYAKMSVSFRYLGTATGEGVVEAPIKVKTKTKGVSLSFDSSLILL